MSEYEDLANSCFTFVLKYGWEFPNCFMRAGLVTLVGEECMYIAFANVPDEDAAPNRIIENANGFMKFVVYRNENGNGFYIEKPIMHYRDKTLKYRKITAPTRLEALDKLAAWMIKNKDIILASKPSRK